MIEVLAMFMSETRLFVELKITTEAQMYDSAFLLSYILYLKLFLSCHNITYNQFPVRFYLSVTITKSNSV